MGDFHQNGIITTLHNLGQRTTEDIENDLRQFSKKRPIAVIIPSLYSELETPALATIVEELKQADYVGEIVIGLDQATEQQYSHALEFFSVLPQKTTVLWNDGPALGQLQDELNALGLAPQERGKGQNVWYCMGYVLAATDAEAIALHDADIVTYDRSLLARLVYPVANPKFSYEFCKGYYSRIANEKLNGRVCRLLVSPVIQALKKVVGEVAYLQFMGEFKYALAGEFSFRRDVLSDIRIPSDWGLEIGILSEMHRNYSSNKICQADIADRYDHKHQSLSEDDVNTGLSKMSIDICKALFRKLATQGISFSQEDFRALKATYFRTALDYVNAYHSDASINGLNYDIHQEERSVELFAENIIRAGEIFLDHPMETPFIPSWDRVISAMPDVLDQFHHAVKTDNEYYSKNNA